MIDPVELKALVGQAERDNDFADVLRDKAFLLARQVLALSDEVKSEAAKLRRAIHEVHQALDRAEAAEAEAQALRERMGEINKIAAQYKEHQYRWLEAEMGRIAALSTTQKEKEG